MALAPKISRRRWSEAFKKRIVAEARQPGMTVAKIARRYDLDPRRVASWEKKFGSGTSLVPVEITPDDHNFQTSSEQSSPCIVIDLPCGTKVQCRADVGVELVAEIIAALRSRR